MSISLWTSAGVVRRLKAICQSLSKTNAILRVYDINSFTPDDEIMERVLELVNDAHVAWPTQCVADNAKQERGGKGVWRFVFDQEGPTRGLPHHAADLMYLFDNIQLPKSAGAAVNMDLYFEGPYDLGDEDEDMHCVSAGNSHLGALTLEDIRLAAITSWQNVRLSLVGGRWARYAHTQHDDDEWMTAAVDEYSYARVRDTIQECWISFAYGEAPWREDKVFVFGPEGDGREVDGDILLLYRMLREETKPLMRGLVDGFHHVGCTRAGPP
jgi:hypothetical protein